MDDNEQKEKKQSIGDREEAVLRFWNENGIFQKSLKQTEGKQPYVFYDGPPFATGLPHQGHILQGTIKDIIPRYQTMRGRYVRRQWGWDCHGLPVENLIEKELGLTKKQDIEEYGVEAFNKKAEESVLTYDKEWKSVVPRMGRWVDMENAYKTMDSSYTESIWWAFKTLHEKKLIYEGYKAMHICPRCETTLAASEVALAYKDVKDISVFVKFALTDEPETYFVAWTTTPWTLPGNVALAVGADMEYVRVTHRGETYIMGKDSYARTLAHIGVESPMEPEVVMTGKDLLGKGYRPLFDYYAKDKTLPNHENGWKVYAGDFVTRESGTGIVHIAPAFGEDDMDLGKKMKLPFIQHVGMDGKMKPEVTKFAGMFVKPKSDNDKERLGTDIAILQYLQETKTFFAKENITHSYPHCWRCDWPLLNYAASSWFVNVTAIKPRLIEENKEIAWIPENMQAGRFGKWLEGARDWAISRSRYWGAPIPVWKCNKCANVESIGSLDELRAKTRSGNTYFMIRHGEAESNVQNIVSCKVDDEFHLTERGRAQAKSSALKMKSEGIELIITSPILRTKETAEIVAEALGLPADAIISDARISEVNSGDLSGRPIDEYRDYFTSTLEKFTKPTPHGETLRDMAKRLGDFLYDIDKKYRNKKILIVTHEYGVWLLEAVTKGATDQEASFMRVLGGDDYVGHAEVRPLPFAPIPHDSNYILDYHRPHIDSISYKCSCELGTMERVRDVFDCWFESGSMPFAQFHFMGDESSPEGKLFAKNFPADFIAEAVDQTRGWFYNMLVLSVALFDRTAFKSVITTGIILAEDGQKMSKKLRNYSDPLELAGKYGADALRFYMVSSPVVRGEELAFANAGVDEIFKKITMRLDNVRSFFELYRGETVTERKVPESKNILDRWIIARWQETHAEVTHHLDTHELDKATRPILPFIDDLSTWYVRRSRDRFKSDSSADAIKTTGWILLELSRLIAPFTPFLAEDLYQRLRVEAKRESVHLESWPEMGVPLHRIIETMEEARRIVSLALEERAKTGIKVRQPLARLIINHATKWSADDLASLDVIIRDEVNVKEIVWGGTDEKEVTLDTVITPLLKSEGEMRDVLRQVQELRKKAGLVPEDTITLTLTDTPLAHLIVDAHRTTIEKTANVKNFVFATLPDMVTIQLESGPLGILIAKV